jgi:hypothetical protein
VVPLYHEEIVATTRLLPDGVLKVLLLRRRGPEEIIDPMLVCSSGIGKSSTLTLKIADSGAVRNSQLSDEYH